MSPSWDEVVAELRISADDRAGPVPLWEIISRRLEDVIHSGRLPLGSRIENEVRLSERLGVSRPTVRRAMQELVSRGLLVRKPGAGTQVVMPAVRRPVDLSSLYDDLLKSGREPRTQVLSFEVIPANDTLALALRIPPRSGVTSFQRVRFADGEPLALLHNVIPVPVATLDRADLESIGLYESLRRRGVLPTSATEVIGARSASVEEGSILGVKRGAALLTMTRTAWSTDGRGVEYGSHIYRADRYAFEHRLAVG